MCMADLIEKGVRIAVPPTKTDAVIKPRRITPLSLKLFLSSAFCLTVFIGVLIFATPLFPSAGTLQFTIGVLVAWTIILYSIFVYFSLHRLHKVLKWFKQIHKDNFKNVMAPPLDESDELGGLAHEMTSVISLLWQAKEHERELLQHKSDTITLIEHQLRTALTQLKWSLEAVEVPQSVNDAVVRISGTVQDIINAARIGEGTFGYIFSEVDLVPVIEKNVENFRPRAESRGIKLTFEHSADIPRVLADTDRISIAFTNIISNAIEYTPKDGSVIVSASVVDHFVDVTVKDSGIGMSQEDLGNLFSKMHRGKVAMKMRPDGSGLGLYVAKNILNEHGAEVMIRSEEGQGTQFSVRVPIIMQLK